MDTSVFRKVSLDRLSSPEQLDLVLRATSPKEWVALAGVFLVLIAGITWSCVGSISSMAAGQGVIIRSGGVLNVVATGGGLVLDLNVRVGDRISANQVIAKVAQPVLAERIRSMREALAEATQQRGHALHVRTNAASLQVEALQRQRANAEREINELGEQVKLVAEQIPADEQLAAKGLITKQQALATRQKLIALQDQMASLSAQLKRIDADKFTTESQPQQEDVEMLSRISSLQRELAGAEKQLSMAENVTSPYGGEVIEVKILPGSSVSEGEPILSIQPEMQNLELVAYLPSSQAKETNTGMEAQISPASIKREEYGFMRGKVVYVANFPATQAAVMRNFENDSLSRSLIGAGPVTEVRIAITSNPHTVSGFQWSTARGPAVALTSGTICSVNVVTRRQKPIVLLFPYMKSKIGL
jgi:HlyD family secretion protein